MQTRNGKKYRNRDNRENTEASDTHFENVIFP